MGTIHVPVLRSLTSALTEHDTAASPLFDTNSEDGINHSFASTDDEALQSVMRLINKHLPVGPRTELLTVLRLLRWRLGTLALCGRHAFTRRFPYLHAFPDLPLANCQQAMTSWQYSRLEPFRKIFKAVKNIILLCIFSYYNGNATPNGLWDAVAYDPTNNRKQPTQLYDPSVKAEKLLQPAVVDFSGCTDPASVARLMSEHGFGCIDIDSQAADVAVSCDAVILGSGAGGGPAAAVLAKAGLRVVVVEKGPWKKMDTLPLQESEAYDQMYELGSVMVSDDGAVNIMAGSTLGGGTKVNWAAALRPPQSVIQEWASTLGLPHFASGRFQAALDAVCSRMGVGQAPPQLNRPNTLLKEGLQAAGWEVEDYPSNCQSSSCSAFCNLGCGSGHKQSTDLTFLADAASHGVRIMTGCYAEAVAWTHNFSEVEAEDEAGPAPRVKRVTGVALRPSSASPTQPPTGPRILLRAPLVVASCGSLHTPALLLRSDITCNGNVGANLRLHPSSCLVAQFPPEKGVQHGGTKMWEGRSMSVVSTQWLQRGSGYGPVLSVPATHPGMLAAMFPWTDAATFQSDMRKVKDTAIGLVFARDQDPGAVSVDAYGNPTVSYWPSQRDWDSVTLGLEGLARGLLAAGARTLRTIHSSSLSYEVDEHHTEERFEEFIHRMRSLPLEKFSWPVLSAHQMGSCRMGARPESSVCDQRGECWEVAGLYIADASAMPTCSGVNPMVTTCALAHMVAEGIVEEHAKMGRKKSGVKVGYDPTG